MHSMKSWALKYNRWPQLHPNSRLQLFLCKYWCCADNHVWVYCAEVSSEVFWSYLNLFVLLNTFKNIFQTKWQIKVRRIGRKSFFFFCKYWLERVKSRVDGEYFSSVWIPMIKRRLLAMTLMWRWMTRWRHRWTHSCSPQQVSRK